MSANCLLTSDLEVSSIFEWRNTLQGTKELTLNERIGIFIRFFRIKMLSCLIPFSYRCRIDIKFLSLYFAFNMISIYATFNNLYFLLTYKNTKQSVSLLKGNVLVHSLRSLVNIIEMCTHIALCIYVCVYFPTKLT